MFYEFENKKPKAQITVLNADRVAIAGVDESVRPEELLWLSEEYPFVEWSVLYGKKVQPLNRFPSPEWIAELVRLSDGGRKMNLSLHLCSSSVNVVFRGDRSAVATIRELLPAFRRIQLNVTYKKEQQYLPMLPNNIRELRDPHQIIVQLNGVPLNVEVGAMLEAAGIDVAYLHDMSGGRGKTPEEWLPPVGKYTGYAGGLTPENLREQIPRIAAAAKNHLIYLDLESGVRTPDDLFDLSRAEEVLNIAKEYVF